MAALILAFRRLATVLVIIDGLIAGAASASIGEADLSSEPAHSLPSARDLMNAIVSCGIPSKSVTKYFDWDKRQDFVWIERDAGPLSDLELRCIAKNSFDMNYVVHFRSQRLQTTYDPLYWQIRHYTIVTEGSEWLKAHNFLSPVPRPKRGVALSKYAEELEEFCGVEKRKLLFVFNNQIITIASGMSHHSPDGTIILSITKNQFLCILSAMSAADLESYGAAFGSLGRSAARSIRFRFQE